MANDSGVNRNQCNKDDRAKSPMKRKRRRERKEKKENHELHEKGNPFSFHRGDTGGDEPDQKGIVMIGVQLKNLEDFKRLVKNQGTVFVKKTAQGFTYYVISEHAGVGVINMYKSEHPLQFNEDFNPEEDSINVGFLVEIEDISLYGRVFHE